MRRHLLATMAVLALACPGKARAEPIIYVESATMSGSLNGHSFTNALVTFAVSANSSGATTYSNNLPQTGYYLTTSAGATTVTVAGIGTATLSDSIEVVDVQTGVGASDLLFYDSSNQGSLLSTTNSFFASYNLQSTFSPISGPAYSSLGSYGTTGGSGLTINAVGGSATAFAIPEPSSIVLTSLAGLLAVGFRRAQSRRTSKLS